MLLAGSIPLHFLLAQRRVYAQTWGKTLTKSLLLGLAYATVITSRSSALPPSPPASGSIDRSAAAQRDASTEARVEAGMQSPMTLAVRSAASRVFYGLVFRQIVLGFRARLLPPPRTCPVMRSPERRCSNSDWRKFIRRPEIRLSRVAPFFVVAEMIVGW